MQRRKARAHRQALTTTAVKPRVLNPLKSNSRGLVQS
jgi:hypothetical protein